MIIGIDVGNYDTKSAITTIPSGFIKHGKKPFGATEWLEYFGDYYIPSTTRFSYKQDKTANDDCIILSLLSIGKEIIERFKANGVCGDDVLREKISEVHNITLGVGLPPAHYNNLRDKTLEYYKRHMGRGVSFNYCGYDFSLKLDAIHVFPQDFVAALTDKKNTISMNYRSFIAVDIGGYTVDVVMFNDRKPEGRYKSLPLGVLRFYTEVIDVVMNETGITLTQQLIESVLNNERNALSDECVRMIHEQADQWFKNIIDSLTQAGYDLRVTPCLFLGGGSLLFQRQIKENPLVACFDTIENTHANAIGYEKYITALMQTKNKR